ncbi:MAG TPA: VOC family protein, partial [Chroococcidiopsis sp.]
MTIPQTITPTTSLRPFHVAFPVADLDDTRQFYETVLGCTVGRTSDRWIDFNLFGHQITAHWAPQALGAIAANAVDGKAIPVRHWGVILEMIQWQSLSDRLRQHNVAFLVEPYIRFQGEVGEQA